MPSLLLRVERKTEMTVKIVNVNKGRWSFGHERSIDLPCFSIMAEGLGGDSHASWLLENDGSPDVEPKRKEKPPYSVPSMDHVRAVKKNGFKVASLFSGCGGSCLGYRMAGFEVVYANEFAPHAQVIYERNSSPACRLDRRDVRSVKPEDILEVVGGELDVLDGSPPCQAFSMAGRREKAWGKDRKYEHGATQQNERLFDEYIRILRGVRPRAFIAENVSGLVKGTAKGFFIEIMKALKESGYNVKCQVLDAQWLGVPQCRQRTIFMGVRDDLKAVPEYPRPLPYQYTVRDACPWIVAAGMDPKGIFRKKEDMVDEPACTVTISSKSHFLAKGDEESLSIEGTAIGREYDKMEVGKNSDKFFNLIKADPEKPCPSILASSGTKGIASVVHPHERRKFSISEVKRLCAFPDDFVMVGTFAQKWKVLGNSVPPVMMRHIAESLASVLSKAKP